MWLLQFVGRILALPPFGMVAISPVSFNSARLRVAQISHRFQMGGLGKHIERNYSRQTENTFGAEYVQVARHGGGVAGDVNDLSGLNLAQKFEHLAAAAFARRIEEDGRG